MYQERLESQTDWAQIKSDILPAWSGSKLFARLSTDNTSMHRVNVKDDRVKIQISLAICAVSTKH